MKADGIITFEVVEHERVEREVPPGTCLNGLGRTDLWAYYVGSRRSLSATVADEFGATDSGVVADWWLWLHAAPWFDGTLEVKHHDWTFSLPEKKYAEVNFHAMSPTVARVLQIFGLEDLPRPEIAPEVLEELEGRALAKPRPNGPYR
jgi:hypothetical protein